MMNTFPYKLYLVTDEKSSLGRPLERVVEEAVKGGVDLVQLREKSLNDKQFLDRALRFKEILSKYNVPLIINDNLDIAKKVLAEGIHVGNSDITPLKIRAEWEACSILGYSVEDEAQINSPLSMSSDYIALSPIFATPTKLNTIVEWGIEGIIEVRKSSNKPIVGIGNIHSNNVQEIVRAGIDCVAVVSEICSADSPAHAAENLRKLIDRA